MLYAEPQGDYALSELAVELRNAQNAKWYRRLKIIQLSMRGATVLELAKEFDVCPATVRSYIKTYNAGGIVGLRPRKSPGRPAKVGQLTRDEWEEILRQTPNSYEKLETECRTWTLELLVRYVQEYLDQDVCFQTISAAMRRCRYRTGRSKLRVGSSDPEYQVKRHQVESLESLPARDN